LVWLLPRINLIICEPIHKHSPFFFLKFATINKEVNLKLLRRTAMKVTVNQRCVLIVILAMVFLLALMNGILQSEQGSQKVSETEVTINHPEIKSPKPSQVSQKDEVINPPLYINHASVNEIAKRLKGVGRKIAQRIVKTREQLGDFKKLEDLKAVPGMGSAKIEANKERISFDSPIPKE
jgi:competence ComEA-like helix-hairpin-helix protein